MDQESQRPHQSEQCTVNAQSGEPTCDTAQKITENLSNQRVSELTVSEPVPTEQEGQSLCKLPVSHTDDASGSCESLRKNSTIDSAVTGSSGFEESSNHRYDASHETAAPASIPTITQTCASGIIPDSSVPSKQCTPDCEGDSRVIAESDTGNAASFCEHKVDTSKVDKESDKDEQKAILKTEELTPSTVRESSSVISTGQTPGDDLLNNSKKERSDESEDCSEKDSSGESANSSCDSSDSDSDSASVEHPKRESSSKSQEDTFESTLATTCPPGIDLDIWMASQFAGNPNNNCVQEERKQVENTIIELDDSELEETDSEHDKTVSGPDVVVARNEDKKELSENEEGLEEQNKILRTKNEMDEPPPPPLDITINQTDHIVHIGQVKHIIDNILTIESDKNCTPLDIGSVICTEMRQLVGPIDDVIGHIERPIYTIRFNSRKEIEDKGLKIGMDLYSLSSHSTAIDIAAAAAIKGSDASWKNDEEAPLSEQDFSDDQEELKAKRKRKRDKKEKQQMKEHQTHQRQQNSQKRQRQNFQRHPSSLAMPVQQNLPAVQPNSQMFVAQLVSQQQMLQQQLNQNQRMLNQLCPQMYQTMQNFGAFPPQYANVSGQEMFFQPQMQMFPYQQQRAQQTQMQLH